MADTFYDPAIRATLTVPGLAQNDLDSVKVDPNNLNICLTDYNGMVTTLDGKPTRVHFTAGSALWREAGTHQVENVGKEPMIGIIVEPKQPASARPAGTPDPVVVDAEHQKVEFKDEQIRVIRELQSGSFPTHGHPDNVQVLLTDLNANLTTGDGKTEVVTGKVGEVRWQLATQHTGKILGDKLLEQIVVEMKGVPAAKAGGN